MEEYVWVYRLTGNGNIKKWMDFVFFVLMDPQKKTAIHILLLVVFVIIWRRLRCCLKKCFFFPLAKLLFFQSHHLFSMSVCASLCEFVYVWRIETVEELKRQLSFACSDEMMFMWQNNHYLTIVVAPVMNCHFCFSSQFIFQCGNLDSNLTFYCIIFSCNSLIMLAP